MDARVYWYVNGRSSLPIRHRLEAITGYNKSRIYAKTTLGEKSGR